MCKTKIREKCHYKTNTHNNKWLTRIYVSFVKNLKIIVCFILVAIIFVAFNARIILEIHVLSAHIK